MFTARKSGALTLLLLLFSHAIIRAQDAPRQSSAKPTPAATPPIHHGTAANIIRTLLAGTIRNPTEHICSGLFPEWVTEQPQANPNLRPFLLTLPQSNLFGDWWGLRTNLEAMGMEPSLTYVTDIAGNVTGGKSQGAAYADNIGLNLQVDLEKMIGLEGGSLLISVSQRDGSSLSQRHVGNIFTIQQDYGGQTFKLIDAAYLQKLLDDHVELRLGRFATGDDFFVSEYDYLFMQNAFCGNPVGVFFNSPGMTAYPNDTWGALMKVRPTQRAYIMAGIYNGDPSIRENSRHGVDFSMDGTAFAIAEAGYQLNGQPGDTQYLGNYKAGFWYDNSSYTNYNTASAQRGNWGFYGLFDQVLIPFAQPGSNRGFGVFGSLLVSPEQSISQLPYFFTACFAARGIFASRPTDTAGFGIAYGDFSEDLRDAEEQQQQLNPSIPVRNHETALEWTYRIYLRNSAAFFQPDLQYIIEPGGNANIQDALVIGCQVGINF
jgi:porin